MIQALSGLSRKLWTHLKRSTIREEVGEALHGLYKKDGEKFMGIGMLKGLFDWTGKYTRHSKISMNNIA